MSQHLIQQYRAHYDVLKKVSGTERESVVREAFKDLLKNWAKGHDLVFVPEYEYITPAKDRRYVDGALLHAVRVPFGYWEAKDEKDDLDVEIEYKLRRGYPRDNIIFEDSREAVLIQNGQQVMRCPVDDGANLGKLLNLFFAYERAEIAEFRHAVEQFKQDLPEVLKALRNMIELAYRDNAKFRSAAQRFLKHAQETINPSVTDADVREMLIQHILTEEIFSKVFGEDDFHRQNNVAKELYALEGTFFTGDLKKRTLRGLDTYYAAIRSAAAQITSHHEKQAFLKVIYENFYKVYNKKAADRLGVVYTPNEIVRFMVESADWLCEKHFGRNLIDKDVEILDPAVGTGTFICEMLERFRGQSAKLKYKYLNELHANEVAILPYYVANLNIEATYAAITGEYLEFPNLCFVDTLDNVAGLRKYAGHMDDLFGSVSEENVGRIRRQNSRKISVIIGNPPYNANQLNENENNKNREYPKIDERIKDTYIKESAAQKTKLYDMYARFFRWASDRIDSNGVLTFITNRSLVDSRTFDGFRKVVEQEFNEIYVIDLGGDVRANPKLSGTKHNVFGIQTGVAISFMVKRAQAGKPVKGCRIHYVRRPELETAEEKLAFLSSAKIAKLGFDEVRPDAKHNWIQIAQNDFDELIPVATKDAKSAKKSSQERAIFKLFSLGVSTNRDDWLIDFSRKTLCDKVEFLISTYEKTDRQAPEFDTIIKWSRNLKRRFEQGRCEAFDESFLKPTLYRPFVKVWLYDSRLFVDERGSCDETFATGKTANKCLCVLAGDRQPFSVIAANVVPNLNLYSADATKYLPLQRVDSDSREIENITDWAFENFKKMYQVGRTKSMYQMTREAIFHYVYGVLHDPIYRQKYSINLKRELPRIPLYRDFWQWADWGKALMGLHIGFESVEPWHLTLGHITPAKQSASRKPREGDGERFQDPKALLKADKEGGRIVLDDLTILGGIPPEAWDYKLGNRSALEWILDQYKEKTSKDPTIREKFNTYRFASYKEKVIDLIARVTRVSVETQKIVEAMRKAPH
jgi:predicted helicase